MTPVIPEAEPQARLSGTSGNEPQPDLTRSRIGVLHALWLAALRPG